MEKDCVKCLKDSFERLIRGQLVLSEEQDRDLRKGIEKYFVNMGDEVIPPCASRDVYRKVRQISKISDPFKQIKYDSNKQLLDIYDRFIEIVNKSDNKFVTALRLAISGNIIDYAVCKEFDIEKNIQHVLESEFAIDDSKKLEQEVSEAKTILYLGDNAGEIVLDKVFLEILDHPNIYYAVRGMPIQNDITIDDARQCGIENHAKVIDTGNDIPSTIIEECTDEFVEIYRKSDLIISKGQGNFEGLEHSKDPRIFFLLMIKCDHVADMLGVKKSDFIVKQQTL